MSLLLNADSHTSCMFNQCNGDQGENVSLFSPGCQPLYNTDAYLMPDVVHIYCVQLASFYLSIPHLITVLA